MTPTPLRPSSIAAESPAEGPYKVVYGTRILPFTPGSGVCVQAADSAISVDTGALRFTVRRGQENLLEDVILTGEEKPLSQSLSGEVVARDGWVHTRFTAVGDSLAVEADGPERATVLVSGKLRGNDQIFGRFTFRVHAYRNQPFLRLFFRIFNDADVPAQLVEECLLRLRTSLTDGEAVLGEYRLATGPAETDRLLVRQHQHDAYAAVEWLRRADRGRILADFLNPDLEPRERNVAQIEGWILGWLEAEAPPSMASRAAASVPPHRENQTISTPQFEPGCSRCAE